MIKAVVGANWGDEGKGKITDMLAQEADVVVRFQGGANAGHTIVNDYGKFALHTLPSCKQRFYLFRNAVIPAARCACHLTSDVPNYTSIPLVFQP